MQFILFHAKHKFAFGKEEPSFKVIFLSMSVQSSLTSQSLELVIRPKTHFFVVTERVYSFYYVVQKHKLKYLDRVNLQQNDSEKCGTLVSVLN